MRRRAGSWWPLILGVAACTAGPPLRVYVLTPPLEPAPQVPSPPPTPALPSPASLPQSPGSAAHLEVRRVRVPDYLDTTDILLRYGRNEVKHSSTGRWGERLSEGVTHAVAADLAARLPPDSVVLDASSQPQRQLLITVAALDLWPDGRCVLSATWSIVDRDPPRAAVTGSGTFSTPAEAGATSAGDENLVNAMVRTLAKLADAIASDSQH